MEGPVRVLTFVTLLGPGMYAFSVPQSTCK